MKNGKGSSKPISDEFLLNENDAELGRLYSTVKQINQECRGISSELDDHIQIAGSVNNSAQQSQSGMANVRDRLTDLGRAAKNSRSCWWIVLGLVLLLLALYYFLLHPLLSRKKAP
eukprot:gnl/Trimastix_PCT/3859.p1 GENE.gnl/Trimastix_PCT/3859~~gnl/Trimastix_PCT/3859.p1  ORF type:complete len:130 (+),score=2.49 gnl/Trimastix_PCT/3859:45-392(+)